MKQTKLQSFLEQVASTFIGLGVALGTQLVIFPWFGIFIPLSSNLLIVAIFTGVSVLRGYFVRRLFDWWHHRNATS